MTLQMQQFEVTVAGDGNKRRALMAVDVVTLTRRGTLGTR